MNKNKCSKMAIKIDKKDKKILDTINNNARLSIADISRKTGIQRDSVLYRIKRMEKLNIIKFFHTVINPTVLGYPIYAFVNFVLHNLNKDNEKLFLAYLKTLPNVVYVAKTTGKWDITINIAAKDLKHFDEIITNIRMKFSKIIKEYETASIIEELKYDYMVDLVYT
jgi:Lrp/AsnC family transcriptional regulator, leucine-responsive regulatory protein